MQRTKQFRVRARIEGTRERPRLAVFRGLKTCYLQLIDDITGTTLASASERELSAEQKKGTKTDRARVLGVRIAEKAKELGVTEIVFDRGGNRYHGRVAAIGDGARESGLQF
jgi:large subunit ribosomal protein L18